MSDTPSPSRGRWLALVAALLGWMFDGMEMGLFPQVGSAALKELLPPGADANRWFGVITAGFLVGAAAGGVLFGWLGDKIGRVRAMTLSVLVYAGCSGACGFAGSAVQLAVLRFAGALGMGGEWALGVALVMELWPGSSRGWLAGAIGAFGNLGYAIVGAVAFALNRVGGQLPGWLESVGVPSEWSEKLTAHENWRLLMLSGVLPAVLTLFIRFFVPESGRWAADKRSGKTGHWSSVDLLAVLLGAGIASGIITVWAVDAAWWVRVPLTIVGLVAVATCFLYPVRQYLVRSGGNTTDQKRTLGRMLLAAGLSGVPLIGTWAGVMWMYKWVGELVKDPITGATTNPDAKPLTQVSSAVGAAVGCWIAAAVGGRFGRRMSYLVLCGLSLVTLIAFAQYNRANGFGAGFILSAGVLGMVTAAFYGWLPLYLPELFPTPLRASGQGFGYNFGRILAAVGTLQTAPLLALLGGNYDLALTATAAVYLLGVGLIFLAPETRGQPLPD